jgi:hypothetical protein
MDVLSQKPKGQIKIWTIVGIIAVFVFFVCYAFMDLYYFQAYADQITGLDFVGFFISYNGIFTTAVLVFLIGLFTAKKKESFQKIMLWIMMLTGFYFAMPGINGLFQYFVTYSGLALMYYIGLYLPQILVSVLLVSAILQKDSENKGITNMIAWIGIVVNILLVIFQFVNLFGNPQAGTAYTISTIMATLVSPIAIIVIICLDFIFLAVTKAGAAGGKSKEETLDTLVEKIAKESKKEDAALEDMVEKISRDDE